MSDLSPDPEGQKKLSAKIENRTHEIYERIMGNKDLGLLGVLLAVASEMPERTRLFLESSSCGRLSLVVERRQNGKIYEMREVLSTSEIEMLDDLRLVYFLNKASEEIKSIDT